MPKVILILFRSDLLNRHIDSDGYEAISSGAAIGRLAGQLDERFLHTGGLRFVEEEEMVAPLRIGREARETVGLDADLARRGKDEIVAGGEHGVERAGEGPRRALVGGGVIEGIGRGGRMGGGR